jgi:NAD(P)H-hydrate epimerase
MKRPAEVHDLPALPPRARDAHKGDFGRVLVVAGSTGLTGAACLAALGAQKAGAGLVTVAVPQGLQPIIAAKLTSVMSRPLPQGAEPVLDERGADRVMQWAAEFDAFALGPGLGRAPETLRAAVRLAEELPAPAVIDADGLYALGGNTQALRKARAARLLTPHPGEMARLVGDTIAGVQADRVGVAVRFAAEHSVLLALKGADTVVTDGRRFYVNPTGNPGMATGGTGDVLTGLAAGLLCQGLEAFEALQLAVFVHGLAGDLAARKQGQLSMTAEDLLDATAQAFQLIQTLKPGADARQAAGKLLQR